MTLKYFTKQNYESITQLIHRIFYETGTKSYNVLSCSDVMVGGVRVLLLSSKKSFETQIKVEVKEGEMNALINAFKDKVEEPKEKESWHGLKDLF